MYLLEMITHPRPGRTPSDEQATNHRAGVYEALKASIIWDLWRKRYGINRSWPAGDREVPDRPDE
jgi:hypothetical protein